MFKAFVSSTFKDLVRHRDFAIDCLRNAGFEVDPMETWTASADRPTQFSTERMAGCDLCVLLVALRRGHVPEGKELSITQLEYQAAVESGLDVLVFMLDAEATWPQEFDERDEDPAILDWRKELKERHGVGFFRSDPSSMVIEPALTRWVSERPALRRAGRRRLYLGLALLALIVVVGIAWWLREPAIEEFELQRSDVYAGSPIRGTIVLKDEPQEERRVLLEPASWAASEIRIPPNEPRHDFTLRALAPSVTDEPTVTTVRAHVKRFATKQEFEVTVHPRPEVDTIRCIGPPDCEGSGGTELKFQIDLKSKAIQVVEISLGLDSDDPEAANQVNIDPSVTVDEGKLSTTVTVTGEASEPRVFRLRTTLNDVVSRPATLLPRVSYLEIDPVAGQMDGITHFDDAARSVDDDRGRLEKAFKSERVRDGALFLDLKADGGRSLIELEGDALYRLYVDDSLKQLDFRVLRRNKSGTQQRRLLLAQIYRGYAPATTYKKEVNLYRNFPEGDAYETETPWNVEQFMGYHQAGLERLPGNLRKWYGSDEVLAGKVFTEASREIVGQEDELRNPGKLLDPWPPIPTPLQQTWQMLRYWLPTQVNGDQSLPRFNTEIFRSTRLIIVKLDHYVLPEDPEAAIYKEPKYMQETQARIELMRRSGE